MSNEMMISRSVVSDRKDAHGAGADATAAAIRRVFRTDIEGLRAHISADFARSLSAELARRLVPLISNNCASSSL
jgi:hypothetical protein